jgi:hypothetical protein
MGEVLPDGRIQGYVMTCHECGATVPVNLYGQGTCKCGATLPKPVEAPNAG